MGTFDGKVAIVTGASSGIGAAAALQFAREGAKVVIAARRSDKCEAVLRQIQALGSEGLFVQTDVTKRADIQALVEATLARFGRLDCAVNNAGISGPVGMPVADIEEENWDQVMNVNLKGVWMCMKYEIPAMLQHGKGAIVNVSSIYGFKPSDVGHAPYCTSKFGVIGLSKTAAVDYGQQGIRINVVSPGFTHSEMVDPFMESAPHLQNALIKRYSGQKRVGDAEEIAGAIAWLCSDAASFVNGAVLAADGGDTSRLY
ncbi:MAG TPA: glucose 1-dehydrogenase [Bryobacteraceae bacterium]|nr:glucose 1-dehydrogenase [Bryobacteraceae bacterium]